MATGKIQSEEAKTQALGASASSCYLGKQFLPTIAHPDFACSSFSSFSCYPGEVWHLLGNRGY